MLDLGHRVEPLVYCLDDYNSARPESDIDLAVVSPKFDTMSLFERYEALGLANRDLQVPLIEVTLAPKPPSHKDSNHV
jgi:predicted nucleotidyltransferase